MPMRYPLRWPSNGFMRLKSAQRLSNRRTFHALAQEVSAYSVKPDGGAIMSATDKAKNKIDEVGGKAKEALGRATGDRTTENEGRGDQAKSNLKDAGEKVKDAFKS